MTYDSTSLILFLHVVAGTVGGFIAFPTALLARKGSRLHRCAGSAFVIAFVAICLTGYALDLEELAKIDVYRWWAAPNDLRIGTDMPIDRMVALTAAINTFALYLAVSGWRVWARRRLQEARRPARLDAAFSVVQLAAVAVFVVVLWWFFDRLAQGDLTIAPLAVEHAFVLLLAAVTAVDAGRDLFLTATGRPTKHWWIMHMRKMLLAEAGLLAAFSLRCWPVPDVELGMTLPVVILGTIGLFMAMRGLGAQPGPADRAEPGVRRLLRSAPDQNG